MMLVKGVMLMLFLTTSWFAISDVWLWAIIVVAAIIFDMITLDLNSIWFAAGALIAMIVAILGGPVFIQVPVFFATSILLLLTVGRWTRLLINKSRVATATNAEAYIGQIVQITQDADDVHPGAALFRGIVWTIKTPENEKVHEGDLAVIISQDGNKLIVKKK